MFDPKVAIDRQKFNHYGSYKILAISPVPDRSDRWCVVYETALHAIFSGIWNDLGKPITGESIDAWSIKTVPEQAPLIIQYVNTYFRNNISGMSAHGTLDNAERSRIRDTMATLKVVYDPNTNRTTSEVVWANPSLLP